MTAQADACTVEAAACQWAAKEYPRARGWNDDHRDCAVVGYVQGHADAAATDRTALERANGLLREALKYLLCGGGLSTRITDHLDDEA